MLFKKSSGAVEYMIVGLGNPGAKYDSTRHNVGFEVVDMLAKQVGCSVIKSKFNALYGKCDIEGVPCLIVKPQTYMNNSGEAVAPLAKFYKIPAENIIVVSDDISLEPGRLRIRRKGSDGGHNGLKSICNYMGDNYPRVKMGVGAKPHPDYDLAAWVLGKFPADAQKEFTSAAEKACKAICLMVKGDTDGAMNKFNS
ncbi:MAG: aminoacyl-tRNA hydrolase [Clostridia bacterium]|nr:aminoacyl-tRNA hydrolase [Clostridia bacterium]